MKLAMGCDHAGFDLKEFLKKYLTERGFEIIDKGTHSLDSVDYPDFAHAVADSVIKKEVGLGILICGSGNGINMAANKHLGIRAALCWKKEIAELARKHNDANILSLPARFLTDPEAKEITDAFLATEFEGGRHLNRINKISC